MKPKVAVFVLLTQIARDHPVTNKFCGGRFGVVEVAAEHGGVRALDRDIACGASWDFDPLIVNNCAGRARHCFAKRAVSGCH